MAVELPATFKELDDPDAAFWSECRKRAAILNVPAWKLAEDSYQHPKKAKRSNIGRL
jgi:hypothetical protein